MSDLHKESRNINQVMKSQDELDYLQAKNAKLQAELEALLMTLGRYGRHDADCEVPADICHCGWDAVVEQYYPFH